MALTRTTMITTNVTQIAIAAYRGPSRLDFDGVLDFVLLSSIRPAPGPDVLPTSSALILGVSVGVTTVPAVVGTTAMTVDIGITEGAADAVTMEFVCKLIKEGNCLVLLTIPLVSLLSTTEGDGEGIGSWEIMRVDVRVVRVELVSVVAIALDRSFLRDAPFFSRAMKSSVTSAHMSEVFTRTASLHSSKSMYLLSS